MAPKHDLSMKSKLANDNFMRRHAIPDKGHGEAGVGNQNLPIESPLRSPHFERSYKIPEPGHGEARAGNHDLLIGSKLDNDRVHVKGDHPTEKNCHREAGAGNSPGLWPTACKIVRN